MWQDTLLSSASFTEQCEILVTYSDACFFMNKIRWKTNLFLISKIHILYVLCHFIILLSLILEEYSIIYFHIYGNFNFLCFKILYLNIITTLFIVQLVGGYFVTKLFMINLQSYHTQHPSLPHFLPPCSHFPSCPTLTPIRSLFFFVADTSMTDFFLLSLCSSI